MPGEMQIGRSRRSGSYSQLSSAGGWVDRTVVVEGETNGFSLSSSSSSTSVSLCSSHLFSSARSTACLNYIEHRVSKMDTLAGVAIKYGVEVADIRRLNALVTDRQMFAHKSIRIPLPGRHPPSIMSNGSACNGDESSEQHDKRDFFESFQSPKVKSPQQKVTPAMSSLQGYYGLVTPKRFPITEGTEMAIYGPGTVLCVDSEPLPRTFPTSDPHPKPIAKSRYLVNGFSLENGDAAQATDLNDDNGEIDRPNSDKSIRRRQKIDADLPCRELELLKEEDATLSSRTGKSIAPRPRSGSRTDLDSGFMTAIPIGDSPSANSLIPVRKSSSTSNLQEPENGSSLWPTSKWSLKPDVIAKPLFDGFPKPMAVWRSKAALD